MKEQIKKKVMIVDDEEDFLKMTKLNLERTEKYEVMSLSSAKNIISELHTFHPDVILLDILMPKVDGMEACEMLNNDPIGIKTPIIVLSALDKDEDRLEAYRVGVLDYLVKPVKKDVLIAKIESVLQFK